MIYMYVTFLNHKPVFTPSNLWSNRPQEVPPVMARGVILVQAPDLGFENYNYRHSHLNHSSICNRISNPHFPYLQSFKITEPILLGDEICM